MMNVQYFASDKELQNWIEHNPDCRIIQIKKKLNLIEVIYTLSVSGNYDGYDGCEVYDAYNNYYEY